MYCAALPRVTAVGDSGRGADVDSSRPTSNPHFAKLVSSATVPNRQETVDWKSRCQDHWACQAREHLHDGVAAVTERISLTDCRQSYVHMH